MSHKCSTYILLAAIYANDVCVRPMLRYVLYTLAQILQATNISVIDL